MSGVGAPAATGASGSSRDALLAHPAWGKAFAEVEALLGGRLVAAERQARWRPAWYLDLERDGARVPLYFRGDRGVAPDGVATLRREMQLLELLAAHGIPVPRVYGWCESVPGIVMERVAGRANLATAESEAERRSVLDHYIELLVAVHRLDPALFEGLGFPRPATPAERSLGDLPRWEAIYRAGKNRPEPGIELVLRWLRENVPGGRDRVACLLGDSGQFLFDAGRVTAVLDVELAALGDPVADLGGLVSRDLSEPLGDLSRAVARYRELSGDDFEARDVIYQAIRFCIVTPMSVCFLCAEPPPGLNLAQYQSWNLVYGRVPLELIARLEGVEIEPPEPAREPREAPVHDALVEALRAAAAGDYAADTALRLAEWARGIERFGAALEAEDLEEAGALLGRRPADGRAADAALERRALEAGPAERPALLRFLVRRARRREALLGPALRELEGAEAQVPGWAGG